MSQTYNFVQFRCPMFQEEAVCRSLCGHFCKVSDHTEERSSGVQYIYGILFLPGVTTSYRLKRHEIVIGV